MVFITKCDIQSRRLWRAGLLGTIAILLLHVAASGQHLNNPGSSVVGRPGWLGFGYSYNKAGAEKPRQWLFVRFVATGGPAEKAGLQPQDLITAINGKPIAFADDLALLAFLGSIKPKDDVSLLVQRGTGSQMMRLSAAPMPDDYYKRWLLNQGIATKKRDTGAPAQ